jgi:hypothetical protein
MVMRNAQLQMNGRLVGGWGDELDPNRLRMDMVKAFETCISNNALWWKNDRLVTTEVDASIKTLEGGETLS